MSDVVADLPGVLYPENGGELFFALVSPVGTNEQAMMDEFITQLKARDYSVHEIKLSQIITDYTPDQASIKTSTRADRIRTLQFAGNKMREQFGNSILTRYGCAEVGRIRSEETGTQQKARPLRAAYFFRSVKHPDEAAFLRTIYGHGFYLVAMHSTYDSRVTNLVQQGMSRAVAEDLMSHDEKEANPSGQNTRESFELADFFLDESKEIPSQVSRFIDLVFGALYVTPTKDEYGMFMASSAAQRSGDLSRQVGAAILDEVGDLIAAGCNEVPKYGGGSYWPDDSPDVRDYVLGRDPNDAEKEKRFDRLKEVLHEKNVTVTAEELLEAWAVSGLKDITEFGRTVHAEMDAIMSCTRRGVSLESSVLYATTFPCHNCARHIVAAGISRVMYIEPYAKSEAYSLYGDSIRCLAHPNPPSDRPKSLNQVEFEPFIGIAPRRFADFFSMRHLTGRRIERKKRGGYTYSQNLEDLKEPRLQLSEFSYLEREEIALNSLPK